RVLFRSRSRTARDAGAGFVRGACLRREQLGELRKRTQRHPWSALLLNEALRVRAIVAYPLGELLERDWPVFLLVAADDLVHECPPELDRGKVVEPRAWSQAGMRPASVEGGISAGPARVWRRPCRNRGSPRRVPSPPGSISRGRRQRTRRPR